MDFRGAYNLHLVSATPQTLEISTLRNGLKMARWNFTGADIYKLCILLLTPHCGLVLFPDLATLKPSSRPLPHRHPLRLFRHRDITLCKCTGAEDYTFTAACCP